MELTWTNGSGLPHYERLSFLVGLTAVGLGFALLLEPPTIWLLGVVLVGVISGGTDGILRLHPRFTEFQFWTQAIFWVLPTLLALGGGLFLLRVGWVGVGGYWLAAGLLLIIGLFTSVLLAEFHIMDESGRLVSISRQALHLATYLTAFALYAGLHFSNSRLPTYTSTGVVDLELGSPISQVSVALVSGLLALSLFREVESSLQRSILYAVICGILLAEIAWGLFYWPIGGLMAGFLLLVAFYFVTGLLYNYLKGALSRRILVEFSITSGLGVALLYGVQVWIG
jgi:hypothetical protein